MYLLKGRLFSTQINTAPYDQSILFKKKKKKVIWLRSSLKTYPIINTNIYIL